MLAVELQGHGRTGPGEQGASFEDSADGVAALLEELTVEPVDVLGFSSGGQVAMQLAVRHPMAVRRLVVASAPFRRDGMIDGFWDGLAAATYADLPQPYREADLAVSGDPTHAERMFHLDRELMLTGFTDWPDALVASITAPTLRRSGRPGRDPHRTHGAPRPPHPERPNAHRARTSRRLPGRTRRRRGRSQPARTDTAIHRRLPSPAGDHDAGLNTAFATSNILHARRQCPQPYRLTSGPSGAQTDHHRGTSSPERHRSLDLEDHSDTSHLGLSAGELPAPAPWTAGDEPPF